MSFSVPNLKAVVLQTTRYTSARFKSELVILFLQQSTHVEKKVFAEAAQSA